MKAKVTTILSSLYICIYQDVFKVLDGNSREAVKMAPNQREVKGAFPSLGTIRQPASLASWGRTKQPALGRPGRGQASKRNRSARGVGVLTNSNRVKEEADDGMGVCGPGLRLYTFQDRGSCRALQVVWPRPCQRRESLALAWTDGSFTGWFILFLNF